MPRQFETYILTTAGRTKPRNVLERKSIYLDDRETTRHQRGSSSVSSAPVYIELPLDGYFYSRTKIKFARGISDKGLEYGKWVQQQRILSFQFSGDTHEEPNT